ncbi:MAG: tRNA epoxyqueuosine(34) reductase QueG [Planctomycetota bacterium]
MSVPESSVQAPVPFAAVAALARPMDFGLFGVANARPSDPDRANFFRDWIANGKHGEMGYLAEHLEIRLDIEKLQPGARSLIAIAEAYGNTEPPASSGEAAAQRAARGREQTQTGMRSSSAETGKVARYAWGRDYHKALKSKLHRFCDALRDAYPSAEFRATVDTAPIHEREHAARAGLGWIGKNTLLIHPRHGSFVLLGCVVTTLQIEGTADAGYPGATVEPADRCANCTRCIDACPTDAIAPNGYSLDATRCISYLTLEHRSPIEPALAERLDGWIAGCDVCQDVCPYNAAGSRNPLPVPLDFRPRTHACGLAPEEVVAWDESDRLRHTAGTALTRIKLPMWKRNAEALTGSAEVVQDPADLRQGEYADGHGDA